MNTHHETPPREWNVYRAGKLIGTVHARYVETAINEASIKFGGTNLSCGLKKEKGSC